MTDFLHQQMPRLFPALELDEGTGDSWDLGDCAPEGAALDALADDALAEHRRGETEPMVPDHLPQLVALMLRVRRLNERVLHLTDLVTGLGLTVEVQTREIADLKAWIVELQGRMAA